MRELINLITGEKRTMRVNDQMNILVWGWVFEDEKESLPFLIGSRLIIDSETEWHTA